MLTPSVSFISPTLSSVLILLELGCIYIQQSVTTEQEIDLLTQLERRLGQAESLFFSQNYPHRKYKRIQREPWTIKSLEAEVEIAEGIIRTTRSFIDSNLYSTAPHRIPSAPSEKTQLPSAVNVSKASGRPSTLPGMVVQPPKLFVSYTISQDCTGSNDANSGSLLRALGQRPKKLQLKSRDTGGGIGKRFLHAGGLAESGLLQLQEAPPHQFQAQQAQRTRFAEPYREGTRWPPRPWRELAEWLNQVEAATRLGTWPEPSTPDSTVFDSASKGNESEALSIENGVDMYNLASPPKSTERQTIAKNDMSRDDQIEIETVLCKHCKRPFLKSSITEHIKSCLKTKQEKARKMKEARDAKNKEKAAEKEEEKSEDTVYRRLQSFLPKTAPPALRNLSKSGHTFQIGRQEPSTHDLSRLARSTKIPTFPKSMTARETRPFRMP
jgi:hypothetical protein